MIPYKRDWVTLNKSFINYLTKCSYHLLHTYIAERKKQKGNKNKETKKQKGRDKERSIQKKKERK